MLIQTATFQVNKQTLKIVRELGRGSLKYKSSFLSTRKGQK